MAAVFLVILFITVNIKVTALVLFAVLLVDIYLIALIYYWGLTLNTIAGCNLIFALGMAVDYSSHIAHSYLLAEPPARCVTDHSKRNYKATIALSQMGSSVFHGGFSTFIAISILGFSQSYSFQVFFKTWMGIVIFGMSNGLILLPVVLSLIGPVKSTN